MYEQRRYCILPPSTYPWLRYVFKRSLCAPFCAPTSAERKTAYKLYVNFLHAFALLCTSMNSLVFLCTPLRSFALLYSLLHSFVLLCSLAILYAPLHSFALLAFCLRSFGLIGTPLCSFGGRLRSLALPFTMHSNILFIYILQVQIAQVGSGKPFLATTLRLIVITSM